MASGINLSDNDLYTTMKKVYGMGGAVFTDRVPSGTTGATAAGTGTSRTSISTTYLIPPIAKELLAISPGLSPTANAAGDQVMAFVDIQGTSFKRQPQQVPAPVGGTLLSVGGQWTTPQEWWTIRAPVIAGDAYDWGVTPLIANSHNMKAWNDVMFATIPSGDPTIYSQIQTTVNTFKTAGSSSGGTLQLTAANELYEVATLLAPETAAVTQETQIIDTTVQCNAFDPVQQFIYGQDPPAVVTGASGVSNMMQISRVMPLGIRCKISNPTINFTHVIASTASNNLTTANCVRYTSY